MMNKQEFASYFKKSRQKTEDICSPLEIEDYIPQPITDVSPPRWHLAHSTWFFETFALGKLENNFKPYHPGFSYIFNSYYHSLGNRWDRHRRGDLSRPTVKEIYQYREHIDHRILNLIETIDEQHRGELEDIITMGINHEQQHQELLVTDIKYILATNPLKPVYNNTGINPRQAGALNQDYEYFEGGFFEMGHTGEEFAFDNEKPFHKTYIRPFRVKKNLVTCGEYLEFILDGGYGDFRFWLDEGWSKVMENNWEAPLYWQKDGNEWHEMSLNGYHRINPEAPVTHISYYEADAFARWSGKRLATESEWEYAAKSIEHAVHTANFLDSRNFHPIPFPGEKESRVNQMLGDTWEWTSSAYLPYDGYKTAEGALGEYNGKFMINQMVLRGGSCATPQNHIRSTYRNFFHPDKRWQFSGIRLVVA